jgi:V/A-type H+-transporting ATPase subunit D
MAEIKLNKTELKDQKIILDQLTKYLPTLQLKKQQLQLEVELLNPVVDSLDKQIAEGIINIESLAGLLGEKPGIDINGFALVNRVFTETENIAGVDVPAYKSILFTDIDYSVFSTPTWVDSAKDIIRKLVELREQRRIVKEKQDLLSEELRQTNIKVNLFEKRMIPECRENIRRIKIFLGDQEIAAICNAKIAKDKLKRKEHQNHREAG